MFKLTMPVTIIDVDGNIRETEKLICFDSKEELVSYLSGDTDGDEYGSSLLKLRPISEDMYKDIGQMCNKMSYLFNAARYGNVCIDIVKDDSEERRKRLIKHLGKEMEKARKNVAKNIATRPYKKED